MTIPKIQWVELDPENGSWQSLEGRFYIHAGTLEVREIRYGVRTEPHQVRITTLACGSAREGKKLAQRRMKDIWNGRYPQEGQ